MAVNYNEQILSRAQAWLSLPLNDKRQQAGLDELAAIYSLATGQTTSSCRQCQYSDYADAVKTYERQALRHLYPDLMADSKYIFAPGFENETYVHEGYNKVVTSENLEDADAEFALKNGGKHLFVKRAEEKAPASTSKLTEKQQAVADYKVLFNADADEKLTAKEIKELIAAEKDRLEKLD